MVVRFFLGKSRCFQGNLLVAYANPAALQNAFCRHEWAMFHLICARVSTVSRLSVRPECV